MNILPKKSWHVRTKQNIARVRRDEAKAAEEEKETQRRIALAAQEARTALLRERASQRLNAETATYSAAVIGDPEVNNIDGCGEAAVDGDKDLRFGIALGSLKDVVQPDGHVNFFQDVEAGKRQGGKVNEEYEQEKKKEQDDYEKKIGYLVFLGQDSLEQTKEKPWYAKIDRTKPNELEKELENQKELDKAAGTIGGLEEKSKSVSAEDIKMTKFKSFLDPLKDIRKYLSTPGLKKKLDSIPSTSSFTKKSKRSAEQINNQIAPPEKRRKMSHCSDDDKKEKRKSKKEKHKKKHKSKKSSKKRSKHHRRRHSSNSSHSSSSADDDFDREQKEKKRKALENLRQERLQREREEKRRAEKVLAKLRGEEDPSSAKQLELSRDRHSNSSSSNSMTSVKQKYNSQFNPHLARQNYD